MDAKTRQAMREAPPKLPHAESLPKFLGYVRSNQGNIHRVWVNPPTRRIDPETATEGW